MDEDQRSNPEDSPAAEACGRAALGEAALGQLSDGMTVREYLDALAGERLHADALKVLAHCLPKREAVWWACLIAEQAMGATAPPQAVAALEAARAWVMHPTDDRRRATFPAAEEAGMGTPAGCAAAAAYFSGGSLAPADLPVVAPPDHVAGQMVVGALAFAAVMKEPEKAQERYAAFLALGREVAAGRRPWPQAAADRPATVPSGGGSAHAPARRPSF